MKKINAALLTTSLSLVVSPAFANQTKVVATIGPNGSEGRIYIEQIKCKGHICITRETAEIYGGEKESRRFAANCRERKVKWKYDQLPVPSKWYSTSSESKKQPWIELTYKGICDSKEYKDSAAQARSELGYIDDKQQIGLNRLLFTPSKGPNKRTAANCPANDIFCVDDASRFEEDFDPFTAFDKSNSGSRSSSTTKKTSNENDNNSLNTLSNSNQEKVVSLTPSSASTSNNSTNEIAANSNNTLSPLMSKAKLLKMGTVIESVQFPPGMNTRICPLYSSATSVSPTGVVQGCTIASPKGIYISPGDAHVCAASSWQFSFADNMCFKESLN